METTKNIAKEKATTKANESILNAMMQTIDKSLFVSNSGQNKENIYKKDIFSHCITDNDNKRIRRKIRNTIDSFCSSFIAYKANGQTDKLKQLKNQFDVFYKTVYIKNDYSIESIVSNNTEINKKNNIIKMLSIIKEIK